MHIYLYTHNYVQCNTLYMIRIIDYTDQSIMKYISK